MKKVLVTGATGFIGQYVVQQLLQRHIAVITSSSSRKKAEQFSWFPQTNYIPFNLEGFESGIDYYRYFDSPDAMIHLAWEGLPDYKSSFHTEVNLPRHTAFIKNLLDNGLKYLTVTGTCLEYGMQEGRLREDMPVFPSNPYAIAKDALRRFLEQYRQQYQYAFKWVRLFYMYGKGQNPNSLLSQLDKALEKNETVFNMSGGEQVRDYLPVEKVAEYIVRIALQDKITGIINCCSGTPVTIKQFVKDYLKQKKRNISLNLGYYPYTDYEPMYFWGDDTKLKSI